MVKTGITKNKEVFKKQRGSVHAAGKSEVSQNEVTRIKVIYNLIYDDVM